VLVILAAWENPAESRTKRSEMIIAEATSHHPISEQPGSGTGASVIVARGPGASRLLPVSRPGVETATISS